MLVSVILPVRNEAPFIEEVLRAVLAQDYPRDQLEVIVADGLSDDGTREIVQALAARDDRLKRVENARRVTPAALNLAIRAASGEVIVRVDGHGVIPPNYVSECVAWLRKAEASAPEVQEAATVTRERESTEHCPPSKLNVECPRLNVPRTRGESSVLRPQPSGLCPPPAAFLLAVGGAWDCVGRGRVGEAIALATGSRFGVGNALYRTCGNEQRPVVTDSVPFWAMRRQVFEHIGLFREEMLCHEDYELNYRLRQAGGTILLLPWLRSRYCVRASLSQLARQYWRYGLWKGRFLRLHWESLKFRHLVPPLFIACLMGATITAFFGLVGRIGLSGLAGGYVGFLLLATLALLSRRGRECESAEATSPPPQNLPATGAFLLAMLLPVTLMTLHVCWGAGVWFGLLRGAVPGQPPTLHCSGSPPAAECTAPG